MIQFEQVFKAYNGKAHLCMCGCSGKYSIPSHVALEEANKKTGWDAYDKHSDRSVKYVVKMLNELIDWNDPDDVNKHVTEDYAYVDTGTRRYVVYFK